MKKFRYCDLILYLYYQVIHEKQFYCYRSLVDCRLAHLSLFELQSIKIILKKFEDKATDIHRFYTTIITCFILEEKTILLVFFSLFH